MAERLGEQLLTDVKALLNTKPCWARALRWGVWTAELLYTSVSKPASSAGQSNVQKKSKLLRVISKFLTTIDIKTLYVHRQGQTQQQSRIQKYLFFKFKYLGSNEQPLSSKSSLTNYQEDISGFWLPDAAKDNDKI